MTTIEELMEQLQTAEDSTSEYDTTVTYFLNLYNITSGEHHIGLKLLFKLYKMSVPMHKNYQAFRLEIGQLLKVDGKNRTKINIEASNISREVVKLLEEKKQKVSEKGIKSFRHFLGLYKISPGDVWIPAAVMFGIYQQHYKKKKKRPTLSAQVFHRFCDLNLKTKISDNVKYYAISEDIYDVISKDEIKEIYHAKKETIKGEKKRRSKSKKESGLELQGEDKVQSVGTES